MPQFQLLGQAGDIKTSTVDWSPGRKVTKNDKRQHLKTPFCSTSRARDHDYKHGMSLVIGRVVFTIKHELLVYIVEVTGAECRVVILFRTSVRGSRGEVHVER